MNGLPEYFNTGGGAGFGTVAASDTFFGVDRSQEILDIDGVMSAYLGTFHATDTTHTATLSCNRAFIVAGAANYATRVARDKLNQCFWASLYAQSAATAK